MKKSKAHRFVPLGALVLVCFGVFWLLESLGILSSKITVPLIVIIIGIGLFVNYGLVEKRYQSE